MASITLQRFENTIVDDLVNRYGLNGSDAQELVENSPIRELYEEFPSQVLHDSTESWSDDIFEMSQRGMNKAL